MPERRTGLLAGAVLLLILAACNPAGETVRERILVWNTEATIEVAGMPRDQARQAVASAAAAMQALGADWHAWKPGALSRINQALARGDSVDAPTSVLQLIERSRPLVADSDGLFDPALGGLVKLWGFHTEQYPIVSPAPTADTIAQWLQQRPRLSDLVREGDRLRSHNPQLQLDFGAIGEAAAIEHAVAALRREGVANALINLGGDTYALGRAESRPWRIAIEDPLSADLRPWATLELGDQEGVFVSGNYARYRSAANGERWPHVIDPRDGMPVRGVALTLVLDRDAVLADAASTALMIAGPQQFATLLQSMQLRCALLLTTEDRLLITPALQRRIHLLRTPERVEPGGVEDGDCSQ